MQICLKEKLDENPNYLDEYAQFIKESKKLKDSEVCSAIKDDFVESANYVRVRLDSKYKNQNKVSSQSLKTRIKNKIAKLDQEKAIAEAIYHSTEFVRK